MPKRRPLTIDRILAWADAHRRRTGRWPSKYAGKVHGTRGLAWAYIDECLADGRRGLPGGSSLSRLLAEQRGRPPGGPRRSKVTVEQILAWADQHHARNGRWPNMHSGKIPDSGGENWTAIQQALYLGLRGLPGGSSLPKLLVEHRGAAASHYYAPRLREEQILAWADAHFRRTGQWPRYGSGTVPGTDENWRALDVALRLGRRGLPAGQSLPALLWRHRGVGPLRPTGPLSIDQILAWADEHQRRTGRWPRAASGEIPGRPGETWRRVNEALREGRRGLPAGPSLKLLLREHRAAGRLTEEQILAWADRHHRRTGKWPRSSSGVVVGALGKRWQAIDVALRVGRHGLPGGDTLARLIARQRGVTHCRGRTLLSVDAILSWADTHHRRTGKWPRSSSGAVVGARGELWRAIDVALRTGSRGLPGGDTLARLIARHRGVAHGGRTLLSVGAILSWADAHYRRTGGWPCSSSGSVHEAAGETWSKIDGALRSGGRGLPARTSLAKLLHKQRKAPRRGCNRPLLTIEQIVAWIKAYHRRTGEWPKVDGQAVPDAPAETWRALDYALRNNRRGLRGHFSLPKLIARCHPRPACR